MEANLPFPIPATKWIAADKSTPQSVVDEFTRTCRAPGWNPGVVRLGSGMVAIDYCAHNEYSHQPEKAGKLHSYQVTEYADHPFLAELEFMPHVPRAVKHIYRRDVRLRFVRAQDAWDFIRAWGDANKAWAEYTKNSQMRNETGCGAKNDRN